MPRPKRDGGTAKVQSLKDRSDAVMTGTTLQTVPLDEATFGKVVSFQETEGCSLLEALRRAVRIGVEALLLERTPVSYADSPDVPVPLLPKFYSRTTMPGAQFSQRELDIDAANFGGAPVEDAGPDYAVNAPPGL